MLYALMWILIKLHINVIRIFLAERLKLFFVDENSLLKMWPNWLCSLAPRKSH